MKDKLYINRIMKATAFATRAHGEQKRKYSGEPYINHPVAVASILSQYLCQIESLDRSKRTNIVCAGLLHDVLEDTPVTEIELEAEFGKKITKIVKQVTNVTTPEDGNRAERKALELDHIKVAGWSGKMVKIADLLDNTQDICRMDEEFAKVYVPEKFRVLTQAIRFDEGMEGYSLFKYALDNCRYHAMILGIELDQTNRFLETEKPNYWMAFDKKIKDNIEYVMKGC